MVLNEQTVKYLEETLEQNSDVLLKPGDVLVQRSNTPDLVGTTAIFDGPSGVYAYPDLMMRLRFKAAETGHWFWRYANSAKGRRYFASVAAGSTGSMPKISGDKLRDMPIPLPKLGEQRAIAEALGDVDALLGALDRLIAKKRDLKQAAMQQLLTGQTRLPGFTGEWSIMALGDLFNLSGGYSASREQLGNEGHCYLHYGDIHGATKSFIDVQSEYQDIPKLNIPLKQVASKSLLEDGDVVFVDASEDDAGASKHVVVVNKGNAPFISGLHTIVAKSKTDELAHEYRRYCFQTQAIRQQFLFYAVGTKVTGISKTNISKLTLPVPSLPEQRAIAEVLSDMDAELAALEQRRAKTQALKQGMMQELLTGRIRLVETLTNIIPLPTAKASTAESKPHNWQINEAVVIAMLTKQFGSEKFPLGRKRYTKLSYLMHRHVEHEAQGYLKKAAGPYNPATKYGGPEAIAQKNGYVRRHSNPPFMGFVSADNIAEAEAYFQKWYGPDVLGWLEQFRRKTNDELELLATVDMAMEDLRKAGSTITLPQVKQVIHDHPEWEAKLSRPIFSDVNIATAMKTCERLFQTSGS